jgi:hypothetical protein
MQVGLCAKVLIKQNFNPAVLCLGSVKHPLRRLFVEPSHLLKVLCREVPALYPRLQIPALFAPNAVII